jgi:predicted amidophosphoribosyltransferase
MHPVRELMGGLAQRVVEALLPGLCPCCEQPLGGAERGLCGSCQARLVPLYGAACPRCGAPADSCDEPCIECRRAPPPQLGAVVWGEHADTLRGALLALKHGRRDELASPLGSRLAAGVAASGWADAVEFVTWVPSHPLRRLARPWCAAELLAREVARRLARPPRRLLARRGLGRQTGRTRARRLLLPASSFRVRRLRGTPTVLLVDDVTTTGTTLRRAATALGAAGARAVFVACLARTPDPRSMT